MVPGISSRLSLLLRPRVFKAEISWLLSFNLPHVRGTYKSQEKWDTFMSIMQELAKEFLKNEEDQDLWEKLKWTVIEDPKLDGLNWLEVNTWFAKWVETDLTREGFNHEALVDGRTLDEYLSLGSGRTRHEYFIYVNEEVLDSFEDIKMASDENGSGHFFTLVSLCYVDQLQGAMDRRKRKLAGKPLPEDEQRIGGILRAMKCPRKCLISQTKTLSVFIGSDLWLETYASLGVDCWLGNPVHDEQEITEIWHL